MTPRYRFSIYRDRAGEYRVRFGRPGEVLFATEGYTTKAGARSAISRIQRHVADAEVDDLTTPCEQSSGSETPATIAAWAEATFGKPASELVIIDRAMKELREARDAVLAGAPAAEIGEEIIDVFIVLAPILHRAGVDLQPGLDAKMAVNRARRWATSGHGHGQHVEGDADD